MSSGFFIFLWVIYRRYQYLDCKVSYGRPIDGLEGMWKEATVAWTMCYSGIDLKERREATIVETSTEIWTEHFPNTSIEINLESGMLIICTICVSRYNIWLAFHP
jgi:hypothetical protein